MIKNARKLPPRPKHQTRYCNCQKAGCFPCQEPGELIADTEDGQLQLCRDCAKQYGKENHTSD